jgi:hypothetical protein
MRTRRLLKWSVGLTLAATAAIALLHAPIVMRLFAGSGGCPFGRDGAALTPAERASHRQAAMARLKGVARAASRPAGDFALGVTTRADALARAEQGGRSCRPGRDRAGLECSGPDARSALYLDFDAKGALVGLMEMSYASDPDQARAAAAVAAAAVERAVGAPTRVAGEADAAYLAARPLRQTRTEYRRANYFASVSATNMGASGYLVSRVYQAID